MVKKIVTWILVADHQHARVLQNDGPGRGLSAVPSYDRATHLPPSRDIVSDGPGKGFASSGGRHHAMQPKSDPHRAAGQEFISATIRMMEDASQRDEYNRLIVVAPARALGEIREALPASLRHKLVGELVQDLTKSPIPVIAEHIADLIAV